MTGESPNENIGKSFRRRKTIILGLDSDALIKRFFGINAFIALFILTLITIFLFKEGIGTKGNGFFSQYKESLELYRKSGLEYADILQQQQDDLTALNRFLTSIRGDQINILKAEGKSQQEIVKAINSGDAPKFFMSYMRISAPLKKVVTTATKKAVELRDNALTNKNLKLAAELQQDIIQRLSNEKNPFTSEDGEQYAALLRKFDRYVEPFTDVPPLKLADAINEGKEITADDRALYIKMLNHSISVTQYIPIDFKKDVKVITDVFPDYEAAVTGLQSGIPELMTQAPSFKEPSLQAKMDRFIVLNEEFLKSLSGYKKELISWDRDKPVTMTHVFAAFVFGNEWITASDQQDFYGLGPLISGSMLIAIIALIIAIPFGVGAAVYVNQIAGQRESNLIKPYIEFIQAVPSVVIGFFGVIVFGEFIRMASNWDVFRLISDEPISERLNAFTAGGLLALMAIPTIFTLSEDAINNVPKAMKEASFAMGATRLQTTMRIILPTSLSGIISAIMLGFGRVIGETMVVLLCAGNMIAIPDFTMGVGVFFEPVHTMTGIIAQEMGEVVRESLHYRALFVVGIVLFILSLAINYSAQIIVRKYSKIEA